MKRLALVITLCISVTASAGGAKKGGKKGGGKKGGKTPATEPTPAPEATPPPPPPPPPVYTGPKPWETGVPMDKQDQAIALYEEGNTLFAQQAHQPALEKYRAALKLWDHPKIRFNAAVTEIRLEKILEAATDMEAAMKYGDKPFDKELYRSALDYQALLKGRVGTIEGACDQAGTKLLLDGKPWFDCPGTKSLRVLAGEHVIVGEKQNFLTSSVKFVVAGGETVKQKVSLVPLDSAVILKYPYRRWIPWTMVGLGFAVGLGGAGTWFLGKNQMDQFEADFTQQCQNGCEPGLTAPEHRALAAQRDSAVLKGQIGIGMMAAGGGVMVIGLVLAIANRPTRVLPNVEVAPKAGGAVTTVGWRF